MGTMCAMYGCAVSNSAQPIEASSRTLRVAAFQRRREGIGRRYSAAALLSATAISLILPDASLNPTRQRGAEDPPSFAAAAGLPQFAVPHAKGEEIPRLPCFRRLRLLQTILGQCTRPAQ